MAEITINSPEELSEYLTVMDGKIERLEEENQTLRAATKAGLQNSHVANDKSNEEFGKFILGLKTGNMQVIKEFGAVPGNLDSNVQKATTGTPLVGDSATGSYLVPEQYIRDILRVPEARSDLMDAVKTVPMISNSAKYPKKLVGATFTKVTSDAADLTETNPTFTEVDLDAECYALWLSTSEQFLEDNLVSTIGDYFKDIIREAWQSKFDSEMLSSAANPTGLLVAATTNAQTMANGSTSFGSVEADDLYSLIQALTTKAKRRNASFCLHPTILDYIMKLKNAQGDYLIVPPTESRVSRLYGYPIITSDEMPDSGESAVSTKFVVFGDFKQVLFGDRLELEIKFFGETLAAVTNTEVFFRARVRCAFAAGHEDSFSTLQTAAS